MENNRIITPTHTGIIVSDPAIKAEYLYVGDYGKENNIKADFLGYTKRIEKVEHRPVDIKEKLVVTVSTQKGCPMKCNFCDCPKYGFYGNLSTWEMLSEITTAISLSGIKEGKRLNLHFARMGEPTFNLQVIEVAKIIGDICIDGHRFFGEKSPIFEEYHPVVSTMMPKDNPKLGTFLARWTDMMRLDEYPAWGHPGLQFSINTLDDVKRNEMFNGMSLDLGKISDIVNSLPTPIDRKYTLNFAVTSESNLDVDLMNKYFDKDKCIVKITPIHETKEAVNNGYEIVTDFDVYERFEKPLVDNGWDVIVFVPSHEEDSDRITCGNSLLAIGNK